MNTTKGDIVNLAYSLMEISGLTVTAGPEDLELALDRLESMMAEFLIKTIDVGYYFENEPDLATPHNIDYALTYPVGCNLAVRLCPDFGKTPNPVLLAMQKSGYSVLLGVTTSVSHTNYPSRMPVGSGNRLHSSFNQFFTGSEYIQETPKTYKMYMGDKNIFTENFNSWLRDGETLAAASVTADTGLTISAIATSSPLVTYTVAAAGSSDYILEETLQVKIAVTSSLGRILNRLINFRLTSSEI